jgi:hypothetical protein
LKRSKKEPEIVYEFQINEQLKNACQFVKVNADQILAVEVEDIDLAITT